jgi:hypothetical protein
MINDAARSINNDLLSVETVVRGLEPLVTQSCVALDGTGRRPMAARLLVVRELRRAVFIAVGHRFAMALLPALLRLLRDERAVEPVGIDQLAGARGRVLHHGSATIAATVGVVLAEAREEMYDSWRPDERDAVFGEIHRLSTRVSAAARDAYAEEFGDRWDEIGAEADPYQDGLGDARPYRSRTLSFLANHLDPSLHVSLCNSELGQVEHLAVGFADLYHALLEAGCPPPDRLPTTLAHLPLLSGLAALRDEVAERIVFEPDHSPLYAASAAAGGRWSVRALRAPLNARIWDRPGRCPAVDILPPAEPGSIALVARFAAALDELTGGRRPAQVSAAGVSAADVSAALAAVVGDRLVAGHGVVVTPEGVTRAR